MRRVAARTSVSVAAVALTLLVGANVAGADELDDYLSEAAEASFAGRQATWCSFGGHTEFSVFAIEHAGALVMVENGSSSQMIGEGRNSVLGDEQSGIAISDWSSISDRGRYSVATVATEERLGRHVTVVTIDEGDKPRAQMWFDDVTGANLGSEVYDGDGEMFRLSWMIDFDPNPRKIYTMMGDDGEVFDVVVTADAGSLPEAVAGYARVDAYAGPDESLHVFYSDGLFSFSVFVIEGEITTSPFVDADMMKVAGGDYRWLLTPSEIWVQWTGDRLTYVLVGDLPPDHLEQVLAELPRPTTRNILSRIWQGLFG